MIPLNFLQFLYRKKHPFKEKKGSWLFNEVLIFSVTFTEGNSHTCMHVFEGGSYLKPADYMLTTSECSISECCSDVSVIFSTAVVILGVSRDSLMFRSATSSLWTFKKLLSLSLSFFFLSLSHPCLLSDLCCSFSHPSLSLSFAPSLSEVGICRDHSLTDALEKQPGGHAQTQNKNILQPRWLNRLPTDKCVLVSLWN